MLIKTIGINEKMGKKNIDRFWSFAADCFSGKLRTQYLA